MKTKTKFDYYWNAKLNPERGSRDYMLIEIENLTDSQKSKWCGSAVNNLPEPDKGFKWYYFSDMMFLSGYNSFIELNSDTKEVGREEILAVA